MGYFYEKILKKSCKKRHQIQLVFVNYLLYISFMCRCTPEIRTPFCGKQGCELPEQIQKPKPEMSGLDWTTLAGIQGELEGISMGINMTKPDVNFQGVMDALKEIALKVEKIRKNHKPIF